MRHSGRNSFTQPTGKAASGCTTFSSGNGVTCGVSLIATY